jgi:uncharacterized membrane protein YgaE (UPF0421/DUF939 family)
MPERKLPKIHFGMRIWKTVIAVFICAILGMIFDIHPFYSMIAAILCMQANTNESIKKGMIRCVGTFIGGFMAVLILLVIDHTPLVPFSLLYYILISLCIAPVIYLTVALNRESSAFIACVVFLSIVLSHFDTENHYLFALQRILETIAGILIAIIINKFIKNPDKKPDSK